MGRKAAGAKCAGRHVDRKVVGQADAQLAVTQLVTWSQNSRDSL